jgi:hypothetical protein
MRLRLPGPRSVLRPVHALSVTIQTFGSVVATMTELVPQIEQTVTRTIALLEDAERSAPRLAALLDEMQDLVGRLLVTARSGRARTAAELIDRLDSLLTPKRVVATGELLDRLHIILTPERVESAQALLDRLPVLFAAERTHALSTLADQSRQLINAVEAGEMPVSRELRQMPRDIHAMLELIDDLHQVVTGVPGADRARARGTDTHPQASAEEQPRQTQRPAGY